ncbi:MAG: hypothetical protein AAF514_17565, partial [Verrucomicrobiota bacterium]
ARLAGLPDEIIHRAREILDHLEANAARDQSGPGNPKKKATRPRKKAMPESASPQLSLFGEAAAEESSSS